MLLPSSPHSKSNPLSVSITNVLRCEWLRESQISPSLYCPYGSRLSRIVPENTTGSWNENLFYSHVISNWYHWINPQRKDSISIMVTSSYSPSKCASDAALWCFLWCAPEQTVEQRMGWFEAPWRSCDVVVIIFKRHTVSVIWCQLR